MSDAQKVVANANKEIEEAYRAAKNYVIQLRERYQVDKLAGTSPTQVATAIGEECPIIIG